MWQWWLEFDTVHRVILGYIAIYCLLLVWMIDHAIPMED